MIGVAPCPAAGCTLQLALPRTHGPCRCCRYVKKLKMEILAAIATNSNAYDIITELTEYARDISPTMGREAVRAVGRIALSVPDIGGIVERLLLFLDRCAMHGCVPPCAHPCDAEGHLISAPTVRRPAAGRRQAGPRCCRSADVQASPMYAYAST